MAEATPEQHDTSFLPPWIFFCTIFLITFIRVVSLLMRQCYSPCTEFYSSQVEVNVLEILPHKFCDT